MTGKFLKYRVIILLLLFSPLVITDAYAACTNPARAEGVLLYNDDSNVLQYCDGTTWQGLNYGVTGSGGCIDPSRYEGAVVYDSDENVPQLCSGAMWIALGKLNSGAAGGGCTNPTRDEGVIVYNNDADLMQYCDGSTWKHLYGSFSPPNANCPNIGDVCADGTVYAGLSGASTPMYVTRCDAGQAWTGSCTGTRSTLPWNNGNSTGFVTTGVTGVVDGQAYTATLATIDSDSVVGGTQPHQAAQYCNDLVIHGYSDWYLPAKNELNTMYLNKVAIANFDTTGTHFWSSTEDVNNRGWSQNFDSGGVWNSFKDSATLVVRCARR